MTDVRQINVHRWRDLVAKDRTIPAGCYRLAYLLSSFVSAEKGYAWPSQKRLARELGVDVKTVKRHVRRLEDAGYLEVQRSYRNEPTNEYRLRLPDSRQNSTAGQDNPVPSRGQMCPKRGDKTVPQSPLVNLSRTFQGDKPQKPVFEAGIAGQPKATRPSYGKKRRGQTELVIANRLGAEGMDRLSACDEETVSRLCTLQQQDRLSDQLLFEVCPPIVAKALAEPKAPKGSGP